MYTYRIINESSTIDQLLANLSKAKEIPALVKYGNHNFHTNLIFNYKTGNVPLIVYKNNGDIVIDDILEVNFFYKDAYFSFNSEITNVTEKSLNISAPKEVQVCFLRSKSRYMLTSEEKAYLIFKDNEQKYEIIDISTSGFSFYASKNLFSVNTIIRNICLVLDENTSVYVDGEVKNIIRKDNDFRYGVNILSLEWSTSQQIFGYLFSKTYPEIKPLSQYHMEEIWKLYHRGKYVSKSLLVRDDKDYMEDIEKLENFKDKPTISVNLIYQKSGKLLGLGSALRIYRRTFLGYLPHVVPQAHLSPKAKTDIFIATFDNLLNHPYFENYISYFKENLQWYKNIFEKIFNIVNDQNIYNLKYIKLFSCSIEDNNKKMVSDIYSTDVAKISDFMEYCNHNLSQLELQCFDYKNNSFNLEEIKELYSSLGMTFLRKLFCIKENDNIIAYVVVETCSYKQSYMDYLDNVKVYLTNLNSNIDINEVLFSVVKEVSLIYKINNKNNFTIVLHSPYEDQVFDDTLLSLSGIKYIGRYIKVMMNKQGVMEFSRLLTANFETYTKFYPLTQPQKSIWFTEKFFPGTSIGNIIGSIKTRNEIDFSIIEKAFNTIVEKNDGMRLRIVEENGEQMQYLSPYKYFKVDFLDFRESGLESYYEWDDAESKKPFDLIDSPLYYFAIIRLPEYTLLYFKTHHLISDAWTINLLGTQFIEAYNYIKNNTTLSAIIKPSYFDFILDEEEYKYSQKFDKNKIFWHEKFNTIPQFTSFEKTGISFSTKAKRKTFILTQDLSSLLSEFAKTKKISVFSMFISLVSVYFSKLTDAEDLVIGTPILNRSGAKEKEMTGMFVSSIPLRLYVDKDMDFFSYLSYVTKEISLSLKNQKYNYDMILEDFRSTHNLSRGKLFDIVVSYQNAKYTNTTADIEYEARWHFNGHQSESLVIHVDDREDQGKFLINIDYLIDTFSQEDIDKLYKRLIKLLKDTIICPDKNIGNFNILTEVEQEEISQMLKNFNGTEFIYPKDKTIYQFIYEQGSINPYSSALIMDERSITYKTLNERSNRLARYLRKLGVTPGTFVGIMETPSIELVVGIIAILKAGGAYLPLDPQYPHERINFLLDNCEVNLLLTRKDLYNENINNCELVYLDDEKSFDFDSSNLDIVNSPTDLAYIIFTSGSTGNPKGVMINHRNLVNQIFGLTEKLGINSTFNHILLAKITFDVSVQHIFTPLITGGKLYIPADSTLKDTDKFWKYVYKNEISIINTVPAFLDTLLDNIDMSSLHTFKYIMVGGDVFKKKLFDKINNSLNVEKIINIYGPTECTINATLYECLSHLNDDIIPIGKPLFNYSAIILDSSGTPVPVGVTGELCFYGDSIASGYLKAPQLTKEKFVNCPINPDLIMYKTGDLAKWLPDGNIMYIGRMDRQVKINGIRIELGEIENTINSYKGVKEALILDVLDNSSKKQLCAYVLLEEQIDLKDLKKYLYEKLPSYMVPHYFVEMDKFPLNPNGKVDKKSLPKPQNMNSYESHHGPSNNIEAKISVIIDKLLVVQSISTHDNLFDHGLDSIKMVALVTSIKREFNVNLSFECIYNAPTIHGLSKYITEDEEETIMLDNLIQLAKGTDSSKNVFLIHSGSGEISTYMELCFNLNKEYNYWAIKMHSSEEFAPKNITINELAQKYIKIIKKIQPEGPYKLLGWCIGGTIAFEIARQLENGGDEVNLLALINTIPPIEWDGIEYFDLKSEIDFLEKYLNIEKSMIDSLNFNTLKDVWNWAVDYLEREKMEFELRETLKINIPKSVIAAIPKFDQLNIREIVYYLNVIRTLHNGRAKYFPDSSIKGDLNFFKSSKDKIVEDETIWTKYCHGNFTTHIINGEHVTIFYKPYNEEFAFRLNSLLEKV